MRKKMGWSVALLCAALLSVDANVMAVSPSPSPPIFLDGEKTSWQSVILNGRTLVPLRQILETLGAKVEWEGRTQTVTAKKGDTVITLNLNQKEAYKDGQSVVLDVPASLIQQKTYVPLRFISSSLGSKVEWDGKSVHIFSKSYCEESSEKLKNIDSKDPYYFLKKLHLYHIILEQEFSPCEIPFYAQKPISTKELSDWFARMATQNGVLTLENMEGIKANVKKIPIHYDQKQATVNDVWNLTAILGNVIDVRQYRSWSIESSNPPETLTYLEAARIVYNYLNEEPSKPNNETYPLEFGELTYIYDPKHPKEPIKVCNIQVDDTDYYASRLSSFLYNEKIKKPENYGDLDLVSPETVAYITRYWLYELEKQGIDTSKLFNAHLLRMHSTNVEVVGSDGYALWNGNRTNFNIYILGKNSNYWGWDRAYEVVLHEIGHIAEQEFLQDYDARNAYQKLRNIPLDWTNSSSKWGQHPQEVFAEDFKQIFLPEEYDNQYNQTDMGSLTEEQMKQFKELMLTQIRRKAGTSSSSLEEQYPFLQTLKEKEVIKVGDYLQCEGENYLDEKVSKAELSHYFNEWFTIKPKNEIISWTNFLSQTHETKNNLEEKGEATIGDLEQLVKTHEYTLGIQSYFDPLLTKHASSQYILKRDFYPLLSAYLNDQYSPKSN